MSTSTERKTPETLRGREISASLTVNDLAKSLAWYRDIFGFHVEREFERDGRKMAVSLKAGAVAILITQDDGKKGANRVKGEGFSMMITTTQSVDEIAAAIKQRGGTLDSEPESRFGRRAFRLHDPDGFKFVVSTERQEA
ncbi:MAG TPA: VOC family protein [Gemmatimonadaceae bacterium]|nr:VOC family protein [Gemmatimonadaceae bacterium]